jgi:hypothetical protein
MPLARWQCLKISGTGQKSPWLAQGRLPARLCRFVRALAQGGRPERHQATKACLQIFSRPFSCVTLTGSRLAATPS